MMEVIISSFFIFFSFSLITFKGQCKKYILEVEEDEKTKEIKKGGDYHYDGGNKRCATDWHKLSTGCYYYEESPMTWEEAKELCSSLGAKMAVVESEQERKEITWLT